MLISLHNITIRSGDRTAFAGTNWQINSGETWAVLGATGAGKSTLAKALCKRLPLSSGFIKYFFSGEPNDQGRGYLLPGEIAYFSTETHQQFLRTFTGYHQARWQSFEGEKSPDVASLIDPSSATLGSTYELAAAIDSEALSKQKEHLLQLFQISHLMRRKVHLLSHGESRKVFLTRLLLQKPRLLILDDPFTGLDEDTRGRFRIHINHLLQFQEIPVVLFLSRNEDLPDAVTHIMLIDNHQVVNQGHRDIVQINVAANPQKVQPHPKTSAHSPTFFHRIDQFSKKLSNQLMSLNREFVRMQEVCVTYSGLKILNQINWVVNQGERWALSGANGAGKTTLLSLIMADHPQAYSNSIFLFGRERGSGESIWEIKRRIGWVSPELQIYYELPASCLEIVGSGFFQSIGLYRKCTPSELSLALEWMKALEIDHLAHEPFQKLSAGQRRLVLLARALVNEPPLLILDEPCQGLDDLHRRTFVSLVEQLCERAPLTLIYVTHDRSELPSSINHHLVLDNGSIASID